MYKKIINLFKKVNLKLMGENTEDFVVLSDKPVENIEEDIFGHKDIAESIIEVVKKAPRPFNIGIYGRWGVGKSTICKIIENFFKRDSDYEVVYFDTWKYERDSFRRQFLITLDESLNLGLDFKTKLNQSLSEKDHTIGAIKRDTELLLSHLGIICLVLFPVGLVFLGIAIYVNWDVGIKLLAIALSGFSGLGYIINLQLGVAKRVETTFTYDKTDSAEGFEEHFTTVLEKIGGKKLIVIIDNLDRLSSSNAVTLLSDIKTFLSDEKYGNTGVKNNSIFIVPCDSKALNDQLREEYGVEFDTEEYLRKFFNHSIQIPKFLNLDLDDFIIKKLNATNIESFKDNFDLVFILSFAFRNSPREIIQFVNSLISLYLLAKKRKVDTVLETKNLAFLAKLLVIRVRWPRIYSDIEDLALRTGDKLSQIITNLATKYQNDEAYEKLLEFQRQTEHIDVKENQDVYFSIRQSKEQNSVPEWDTLLSSLIELRVDDVKKIFTKIKENEKLDETARLLNEFCTRNIKNANLLVNIFLSLHRVVLPEDISKFQATILHTVKTLTDKSDTVIDKLELENILCNGLSEFSTNSAKICIESLMSVISETSKTSNLGRDKLVSICDFFRNLDKNFEHANFTTHKVSIIQSKNSFLNLLQPKEVFPDAERNENFKKAIFESLMNLISANRTFDRNSFEIVLKLFSQFYDCASIAEEDEYRTMLLNTTFTFLSTFNTSGMMRETNQNTVDTFTGKILNIFNANRTPEEKAVSVRILEKMIYPTNQNKDPENTLRGYISDVANKSEVVVEALGKDLILSNKLLRQGLVSRSRQKNDMLLVLDCFEKLDEKEIADIFRHLIPYKNELLVFLKKIDFKIPKNNNGDENFLKNCIQQMIDSIDSSEENLIDWLSSITKLGIATDQDELFFQKIRQCWNRFPSSKKSIALFIKENSALFGDIKVKEFSLEE